MRFTVSDSRSETPVTSSYIPISRSPDSPTPTWIWSQPSDPSPPSPQSDSEIRLRRTQTSGLTCTPFLISVLTGSITTPTGIIVFPVFSYSSESSRTPGPPGNLPCKPLVFFQPRPRTLFPAPPFQPDPWWVQSHFQLRSTHSNGSLSVP